MILVIFVAIHMELLTLVSAQSSTNTSTTLPSVSSDTASPPCSLYDIATWGISTAGSTNGLFRPGGVQQDHLKKIFMDGKVIDRDPIFLPMSYSEDDRGINSTEDPVFGTINKSTSSSNIEIDKNAFLIPCIRGKITGIIPRRDRALPDEIGNNIKGTNCNIERNLAGSYSAISFNTLCPLDNKIGYGLGNTGASGGCSLDMEFTKSINVSINPNSSDIPELKRVAASKWVAADGGVFLRLVMSPGTQMQKVDLSKSDDATKLAFTKTVNGLKFYSDRFRSWPPKLLFGSTFSNTGSATFMFSENLPKYDTTKFPKDIVLNSNIEAKEIQSIEGLGVWLNTNEKGITPKGEKAIISSNILLSSINDMADKIKAFYYIPKYTDEKFTKSSFVCNKRNIQLKNNSTKETLLSIPLYEWIPGGLELVSAPTCEKVVGQNSIQPKVIPLPSAVKGQSYLVCTPCILPSIFQTDLFGQPVTGIPTAIGCLPSSGAGIITVLLRVAATTGGGIAALIVAISAVKLANNAGNAEEVKKIQQALTSAVIGLLVIVTAVFLLNVVGIRILDLGAFGGRTLEIVSG